MEILKKHGKSIAIATGAAALVAAGIYYIFESKREEEKELGEEWNEIWSSPKLINLIKEFGSESKEVADFLHRRGKFLLVRYAVAGADPSIADFTVSMMIYDKLGYHKESAMILSDLAGAYQLKNEIDKVF